MITTTSTPTKAKALLLKDLMFEAATLRVSPLAQAVLAHIIAESWPHDDGWHASMPIGLLAWRLGRTSRAVKLAVLEIAQLLHHEAGDGRTPSTWLLGGSKQASTQGRNRLRPSIEADFDPGAQPASTMYRTGQEVSAAGGVSSGRVLQQAPNAHPEILEALRDRPRWLRSDQAWISPRTAEELASLAHVTPLVIAYARKLLDLRRGRLSNPAGYFVSQVRDPEILAAAQRETQRKGARR